MNICKYCKSKGMTKEEYNNFKNNIKVTAIAIRSNLKYNGGMYYNTNTLLKTYLSDPNMVDFIIQELKLLGIEFMNNNELYRVVE